MRRTRSPRAVTVTTTAGRRPAFNVTRPALVSFALTLPGPRRSANVPRASSVPERELSLTDPRQRFAAMGLQRIFTVTADACALVAGMGEGTDAVNGGGGAAVNVTDGDATFAGTEVFPVSAGTVVVPAGAVVVPVSVCAGVGPPTASWNAAYAGFSVKSLLTSPNWLSRSVALVPVLRKL